MRLAGGLCALPQLAGVLCALPQLAGLRALPCAGPLGGWWAVWTRVAPSIEHFQLLSAHIVEDGSIIRHRTQLISHRTQSRECMADFSAARRARAGEYKIYKILHIAYGYYMLYII
jgi:hypothetical protein